MKNWVSKLRIYRTSTSPYFPADFNDREKVALESPLASHEFEMVTGFPCDIMITNTHTDFSAINVVDLAAVKLIIHPNSGYDNFTADLVRDLNADVVVGNPIRDQAVAQYILSAFYRHLVPVNHQSSWSKERSFKRKIINDLKITIIGHGHIGKLVSSSLKPQVKNLTIIDPQENLHGSFAESDVVILNCGLNLSTRHMINSEFLKQLHSECLIINTSRGEIINTNDLVVFLEENPQAFAVLDVFESEPNDFSVFRNLKNIITTSHIAGVYQGIDQATINFERSVISDFLTMKNFKELYQSMILRNRIKAEGLI